jgi:hypothetical protein
MYVARATQEDINTCLKALNFFDAVARSVILDDEETDLDTSNPNHIKYLVNWIESLDHKSGSFSRLALNLQAMYNSDKLDLTVSYLKLKNTQEDLPKPITKTPSYGDIFWTIQTHHLRGNSPASQCWQATEHQHMILNQYAIFKSQEDAQAWIDHEAGQRAKVAKS